MRILAVSDKESPALWDHYQPGKLKEFDLILSCGDLKAEYLSFLVTMGRCPVLYVHGARLTAVTVLTISWWFITVSGFWVWAAAASTIPALISTRKRKCAGVSESCVISFGAQAVWMLS